MHSLFKRLKSLFKSNYKAGDKQAQLLGELDSKTFLVSFWPWDGLK